MRKISSGAVAIYFWGGQVTVVITNFIQSVFVIFMLGAGFLVWITIGGFKDLVRLFRSLRTEEISEHDDGSVEGHHAAR